MSHIMHVSSPLQWCERPATRRLREVYPGRCDFGKHHSAIQAPRFQDSAFRKFERYQSTTYDPCPVLKYRPSRPYVRSTAHCLPRNVKAPAAVKAKAKVEPKQKAKSETREKKDKRETKEEESEKPKKKKSKKDWSGLYRVWIHLCTVHPSFDCHWLATELASLLRPWCPHFYASRSLALEKVESIEMLAIHHWQWENLHNLL